MAKKTNKKPSWRKNFQSTWKKSRTSFTTFLKKRGLVLAIALTVVLLVVTGVAVATQQKPVQEETQPERRALQVETVIYGQESLTEEVAGTIKNLNAITLVAQSNGPVSRVNVFEGDQVQRGAVLMNQETAYAAGNAATVQRQISQKNLESAQESLDSTVETVAKQREQADKNRDNQTELKEISESSILETEDLIAVIETQVDALETAIETAPTVDDENTLRGSLINAQSNLNTARQNLRTVRYQTDEDEEYILLQDISKDLVYKTTEIQLKTAEIQRDIAKLQLRAAQITEATTRVTAPFAGVIEKVYVQPGEYVNPGDPIAVLRGNTELCLQMSIPGSLAKQIDTDQPLVVTLPDGQTISLGINHVSAAPVNGQLYEVLAGLPEQYHQQVYDEQSLSVALPLYELSALAGAAFVPLDSVFITSNQEFVFVNVDGVAEQRLIETGAILGDSIEIIDGLLPGDEVIVDRRVIAGQLVETVQPEL